MSDASPPALRVAIVALGTRGDVEPAVRLGTALRQRGDEVVVSTFADGAEQVRLAGLRPSVVGPASAEVMWWRSPWARGLARRHGSVMYLQTRTRLARHADAVAAALVPEVVRADLVVCGLAAAGLVPVLQHVGVPARLVLHAPLVPHLDGICAWSVGASRILPRTVERHRQDLMWALTRGLSSALARALARRLAGTAGSPSQSGALPHSRSLLPAEPPLAARPPLLTTSPVLDPHPAPEVVQTGWWADPTPVRPLPAHVDAWLTRHPGAVLFSLGSLAHEDPDHQVARLTDVARRAGVPAVVQAAGARTGRARAADTRDTGAADASDAGAALVIGDVDHRALIPRVRAVVHHGGSGTTHSVAAVGRPQVVIPVLGDQPHYARQVRRTGVGTVVLRPGRGSVTVLSRALRAVLHDPAHARAAAETARSMQADDGLGRAVHELTHPLSSPAGREASC